MTRQLLMSRDMADKLEAIQAELMADDRPRKIKLVAGAWRPIGKRPLTIQDLRGQ